MMERPLTGSIGLESRPFTLEEYEEAGGYAGLRGALAQDPAVVREEVTRARLRGRGGAGFPTGVKWGAVPVDDPRPRYFVVNGDEMEPGTMKDRVLLEGAPHLLIEGTIISAYAIGARVAYIFVRWGYGPSVERLRSALREAHDAGYLGTRVGGTDYALEIHLHVSAGRYMCGEETGLLNALEGKRANPRGKPPFPQVVGLWGQPTVVNNVETVCNIPPIMARGWQWFREIARSPDGGTKLYGVSGKVKRPGVWELPLGATMREILEGCAGGIREGLGFRGALPGGASTGFLLPQHLDLPMDFESVELAGSRLGTGTMVVLDDRTCPVGLCLNLAQFFARESCGWCTPCREGLPWVARALQALEEGHGTVADLETLDYHARLLQPGHTFCALAPGAMAPLGSALACFRNDFIRHVDDRRCPWR